jgi:thioredoxin 1
MRTAMPSRRKLFWSAAIVLASLSAGCHNGLVYPWAQKPDESDLQLEHVTSATFEDRVLKCDKPVLVDFYGPWCVPCSQLSPILADFAKEHQEVRVVKINVDDNHDLAVRYDAKMLPYVLVFRNGRAATKSIGVITKAEMAKMVKEGAQ